MKRKQENKEKDWSEEIRQAERAMNLNERILSGENLKGKKCKSQRIPKKLKRHQKSRIRFWS